MQTIYFSERLLCQLERLHTVPLTLVEAPAGYGKTTALKHALRDVPYGALRWHNAQDATVCCDWLVRQIAQKDSALAQQIFDLYHENGPFVHAKPAEESSLYLMIDNFQVIAAQFPFSVLQLLSALKGTAVHVIFLSRSFWQLPIQDLMHVCYISKKDFFLRKEDIICFAEELGISLTEKQAIHIQKETGGWAAVVSLYLQNGCEEVEWKKLSRLMEDLFWRRQEDILKKALLRLAQFETVDVEMVRALTEDIADLQQMGEWFYSLPLLYYDAEQQRYCLCALLRKFLLYRLHNASFLTQWDSYHRCGCWYRETNFLPPPLLNLQHPININIFLHHPHFISTHPPKLNLITTFTIFSQMIRHFLIPHSLLLTQHPTSSNSLSKILHPKNPFHKHLKLFLSPIPPQSRWHIPPYIYPFIINPPYLQTHFHTTNYHKHSFPTHHPFPT